MSVDVLQQFPQDGIIKPLDECHHVQDMEASFSVKLYPDGFVIGKPLEQGKSIPPPLGVMDLMHPYNRTSESFLRALDGGWIPGALLDDIPCKYVDGCIVCEIHDYCANAPETQSPLLTKLPLDWSPVIYKITLKPTMESIVKDVSSMMDDNWTYADLTEIESRILKTVQPELNLDPKPSSSQPDNKSLLRSSQRIFKHYRSKGALIDRRLRNATSAKAMVRASSLANSKKISFELVPERVSGETTSDSVASKSYQSLGPTGPATQITQSLLSPASNIPLTMAGFEPVGLGGDNKLFNPGKRDVRDYRVRVDTTKIKQEPMGLDKQSQSAVKFDHKLGIEPGVASENKSELIKLEVQYQKEVNSEQQRLGDPMYLEQDLDISSQKLIQQSLEKPQNLSWQVLSPAGDRDNRQDDLLQRKKSMLSPKINSRSPIQSMSSDVSHLSQGAVHNMASVIGSSTNPNIVTSLSSGLAQQKEKLQMQAAIGASGPLDPIMQQLSRRRTSSLPKNPTSVTGVASPSSTGNSGGMGNINSPSTASIPPVVKNEAMPVVGQRKEPGDNFGALLSIAQRHGLPAKRRKVEQLPEVKKTSPSWQLLLVALANTSTEDIDIPKGQRNMADSLAGGNVNVRKTRFLLFQRQVFHGTVFRQVHVRLVMCERGKDVMVEAVVQFGDDQDDETLNSVPHHVLPTMPNAHAADRFARQFCTLMLKEGFELIDDQVHPTMQRNPQTNAASNARSLPAAASTLGNNLSQLSSPRAMMNQHMPTLGTVSNLAVMPQMQPAAQNGLAANHMPPPGNAANRQISAGYLGQAGNNQSSKPLQLDGAASQLTGLQHPQHHQQALSQRAQQMLLPSQLSQLSRNPGQQINPQMAANAGQLHQYFQQQQQQQRQQAQTVLQRKFVGMGGLGTMGSLGGVGIPVSGANQGGLGNVVGMNNVVGMGGMNNVSASMAGISSLNSVGHMTGLNTGLSNLIGQQLRPGTLTPAQMAALSSKAHLTQGQSGHPVGATNSTGRNSVESLTGMNMANQVHMSSGLQLSRVGRVGLTPMQRAPGTSMGSPKVATSSVASVAAQNMYLNSQQLNLQQQVNSLQQNPQQGLSIQQSQLTSQQQVNAQMQQQQQQNPQQQLNLQQQQQQQPPKTSQQLLNPQASLITQSQQQQQINSQGQMNPITQQLNSPLSQQLVGGLGSIVGGPASPQLSSQSLGSVTGASMEASTASHGASLPSSGQ